LREGYSEAVAGVGGVGDEEATKKWSRINPNAHSNNKNTEKYCKIIGHLPIMARFRTSGLDADDADKERETDGEARLQVMLWSLGMRHLYRSYWP
jgi:hypothetical protein